MTRASLGRPPVVCDRSFAGSACSVRTAASCWFTALAVLVFLLPGAAVLTSTGAVGALTQFDHPTPSPTLPSMTTTVDALAPAGGDFSSGARWTNITTAQPAPSPRESAGIAYDASDGYVVLFGGQVHTNAAPSFTDQHTTCTGDTWIFRAGVWSNLSIPGPPADCGPVMTYDAHDGYVLLVDGNTWNGSCQCQVQLDATWAFAHGAWQNLSIYTPPNAWAGAMAYDPVAGSVLLFTMDPNTNSGGWHGAAWSFSDDAWSELSGPSVPTLNGDYIGGLTYDPTAGGLLAYNYSNTSSPAWVLRNSGWSPEPSPPIAGIGISAFTFDPVVNFTVLFGGTVPLGEPGSDWQNSTWLFLNDRWLNASIPGPKARVGSATVFDGRDGYVLMFGGQSNSYPSNYIGDFLLGETWVFAPPAAALRISLSASPTPICSRETVNCGAGTVTTRVTLNVTALKPAANASFGADSGEGVVTWAPQYWIDNPTLEFAGWENLVPSGGAALDARSICTHAGGENATCGALPAVTTLPNGNSVLRWGWGLPATNNTLEVGDSWIVSFNEVAVGPPFGPDPIDSCSTGLCSTDDVAPINGVEAGLAFSPYGNSTLTLVSAPLARVTVLASPSPPNTIPGSSLPPPPPPLGAPLPVGTPAPPLPVASPVAGTVVTTLSSAAGTLSLAAIAGGLVGAGVARGAVRSNPQRVAQPMRAGGRRFGPPPSRGVD